MSFHVTDHLGEDFEDLSPAKMQEVLAELDTDTDEEHSEVSLQHETGWTLSVGADRSVVWENVEDSEDSQPVHMLDVPREKIFELWTQLAQGNIRDIAANPWQPGYPGADDYDDSE